jgi:hypothetical protein
VAHALPVEPEVYGPIVCFDPSGAVTAIEKSCQRSPSTPVDVGTMVSSHITSCVSWPTPMDVGEAERYAYVGTFHEGVCALEIGIAANVHAAINKVRTSASIVLFFRNFIFYTLLNILVLFFL